VLCALSLSPLLAHLSSLPRVPPSLAPCRVCCAETADRNELRGHLKSLVPVLMKAMVYSEMDQLMLGGTPSNSNADQRDAPSDIKPRFYRSQGGGDDDGQCAVQGRAGQWRRCATRLCW
jgi:hypothetical protein